MKNEFISQQFKNIISQQDMYKLSYSLLPSQKPAHTGDMTVIPSESAPALPEVLFITSYPPRQCGIATYSQDLMHELQSKFRDSFSIKVCALESVYEKHSYTEQPAYILDVSDPLSYEQVAENINRNGRIRLVVIQHEFGLFPDHEQFVQFLRALKKPVLIGFHTVLPHPDEVFLQRVKQIAASCKSMIVMTEQSAKILERDYDIEAVKIHVIPHGTHLVPHLGKEELKKKYNLQGRMVLSTFGLLSSGKSIETTLEALPSVIKEHPRVIFLVIGRTHPAVSKNEGEVYREMLERRVNELKLSKHVRFINYYLPLDELLEYLQLTDIYLFTSTDPNQSVSGTFSYAISSGCPIITTPIPQAVDVKKNNLGDIVDFRNSAQLSEAITNMLSDDERRMHLSLNALHTMAVTAWENSAISHALLFSQVSDQHIVMRFSLPPVKLDHLRKMTTDFGIIQFSRINQPDLSSGYTLDDNARALIAFCKHYDMSRDTSDLKYIYIYFNFIRFCLQSEGYFLNYVDAYKQFSPQNHTANLADSNGRAIWALGYLISIGHKLPQDLREEGEAVLGKVLNNLNTVFSTRAMAFAIKGLYYANTRLKSPKLSALICALANRLTQMYKHESDENWQWYESYLTYANSVLPEAMLCAYMDSGDETYRQIAKSSFDFLLSHIFVESRIRVISNKSWMRKGETPSHYGEQPIDVAYAVIALDKFYNVFGQEDYLMKMETAFSWFLGNNHLRQTIYNPCTGGCYDGLEEDHVNLNQGAESSVSYLMARLIMETFVAQEAPADLSKIPDYILN